MACACDACRPCDAVDVHPHTALLAAATGSARRRSHLPLLQVLQVPLLLAVHTQQPSAAHTNVYFLKNSIVENSVSK